MTGISGDRMASIYNAKQRAYRRRAAIIYRRISVLWIYSCDQRTTNFLPFWM